MDVAEYVTGKRYEAAAGEGGGRKGGGVHMMRRESQFHEHSLQ